MNVESLNMTPKEYRAMVRSGEWEGASLYKCRGGYVITDVVIIPKEYAYDYFVFSHRNPRTVSIVDMTEVGSPHPRLLAPEADLRTDLPRYLVYKDAQLVDEPTDIKKYWREDLVGFLLGSSASFHWLLKAAGVRFRYHGVFSTNIACIPSGPFRSNMAVTCRVFETSHDAVRAVQITSRHFLMHGPPVHIGDPAVIGIKDITQPDLIYPTEVTLKQPHKGEIPMFWPCGATNRLVGLEAKISLMIVDYPRCTLVTDRLSEELAVL